MVNRDDVEYRLTFAFILMMFGFVVFVVSGVTWIVWTVSHFPAVG